MVEDFTTLRQLETLMSEDGGPAILDVWSPTCGPCKAMAPAIEALANELADVPAGSYDKGLGKGTTIFEPFLTAGVGLPRDSFLQSAKPM